MTAVRLLVAEGYPAGARARHRAAGGAEASEVYANLLRELHPGAVVDICYPADPGANFPDAGLEGYDGAVFTGSTLNVYDGGPAVEAQITLARAVLEAGTPVFGSCWGLQVLTVACGGAVHKNPKGREIGFARAVRLTPAGASHPMYRGKAEVFDAVTVHLDEVATLAPGTTVLARNEMSDVQAAEIRTRHASVWATQYHPELSLADMAVIVRRFGSMLVQEGFFADDGALADFARELDTLDRNPGTKALAWRHGIDAAVLDRGIRVKEIANWIAHQVLPTRARRGRG